MTPRQAFWEYARFLFRHHRLRMAGLDDDDPRMVALVDASMPSWLALDDVYRRYVERIAERLNGREDTP